MEMKSSQGLPLQVQPLHAHRLSQDVTAEWLSTPQKSAEMNTPEMIEKRRQARIAYWRRTIENAKLELRALGETIE